MKGTIFYQSHHGHTKSYAEQITEYLTTQHIDATVADVKDYAPTMLEGIDFLLLGCWTGGLFIALQGPDKAWKKFAQSLPVSDHINVGLFTTYKLATGSMFKKMQKALTGKTGTISFTLRSKTAQLSDADKARLKQFLGIT